MHHHEFLSRLARDGDSRIVLLVLDGVGDLRSADQPQTPLERAHVPHLDRLASRGSLGRLDPVVAGITPGSGPGHLSLFGYDPRLPEYDIGRGVLEALGLGLTLEPDTVAARGNFATADAEGKLTDRRAGRIPSSETRRLCETLQEAVADVTTRTGLEVRIEPGESHRFVLLLRGEEVSPDLDDTDPQRVGVPPLPVRALDPGAEPTAEKLREILDVMLRTLEDEPKANRLLLRGFSRPPQLPSMRELYKLNCGAFAGYPLYRGVASVCGMEVVPCEKSFAKTLDAVEAHWDRFDFFFIHVKQTDMAGEDGDVQAKAEVLEDVDRELPRLLALEPDVLAVTGDHSTPAPMRAHSWHPVPLLVASSRAFMDECGAYDELQACRGHLGRLPARHLMGLLLAHAGRLEKFGA